MIVFLLDQILKNIFLPLQGTKTTLPWSSSARMLKLTVSSFQILFLSVNFNYFSEPFAFSSDFVEPICLPFATEFSEEPAVNAMVHVAGWGHWDIGDIVTNLPSSSLPSSSSYILVLAPVLSQMLQMGSGWHVCKEIPCGFAICSGWFIFFTISTLSKQTRVLNCWSDSESIKINFIQPAPTLSSLSRFPSTTRIIANRYSSGCG